MGVNWNSKNNPETIPFKGYVPKIALPSVFGDALSYLEDVSKVNYAINKTIEEVNNLAQNLIEVVSQSIENAKIPVYDELVHNGSNIVSPLNWNLSNPETIFNAIGAGKMCILTADCDFNVDHIPVPSNRTKQAFVLTQAYQINPNNNTTTVNAVFVNYNSNKIRYVEVSILRDNRTYTSEVLNFTEYEIPTTQMIQDMHQFIDKKVMMYVGHADIPSESDSYIEITNNASSIDLKSYFMVESADAHLYAPTTCPCVVVDYRSGAIGLFKYGGDVTPWARIYGTGYKLKSDIDEQLSDLYDYVESYDETIGEINTQLDEQGRSLQSLTESVQGISGRTETLEQNSVQVVPQAFTDQQKLYARLNIGAVSAHDPELFGSIEVIDEYGNSVHFVLDRSGNISYLLFKGDFPVIRGIHDPIVAQDVATKGYVDSVIPDTSDCVKVTEQNLTEQQKGVARDNIGAVGTENPYFLGTLSVEANNKVLALVIGTIDGRKVLSLSGSAGKTIIRNVDEPVEDFDAATKGYVDAMLVQSEGNVKFSVSQNLTTEQKSRARTNIGAVSENYPEFYDEVSLRADVDEYPRLTFHSEGSNRTISYTDGGEIQITDDNENLKPIFVGESSVASAAVTNQRLHNLFDPYNITINNSENAWTCTRSGQSVQNFDTIVDAFIGGIPVIVAYQTIDTYGVGYARPIWCAKGQGIMCEGYTGVAHKRYIINRDGTVTTSSL